MLSYGAGYRTCALFTYETIANKLGKIAAYIFIYHAYIFTYIVIAIYHTFEIFFIMPHLLFVLCSSLMLSKEIEGLFKTGYEFYEKFFYIRDVLG